ncbi:hypothetical protein [Azospirillum soli]|uniref:hypothetical protein n=1 Tax=Azospirillum soli TaxID=1304799 RepID=UPI001AEB3374|nr:hypothetical protein [Azospirillum soli]MBP2311299.1 uncharacterized protein YcfL [Azospirillum soli]
MMGGVLKLTSIVALLLLTGCGSDNRSMVVNRLVSPEQELADLARARDVGAITPDEYALLRQKVVVGK